MTTQTTLFPTISQSSSTLPKQQVRLEGAASAQSFAQIMQSFGGGSQIAQSATQSQDASDQEHQDQTVQSDEAAAQGDQGTDGSTSDVSNTEQTQTQDVNSQAENDDADSSQSTNQDSNQSAPLNEEQQHSNDEQPAESDEPEAPFRQLQFQGDHARFTIKGVDRQLTHAADINLAADAKALGTLNHQIANTPTVIDSESAQTNTPNRQSNEPKPEAGSAFTRTQQESIDSANSRQGATQATSEHDQSRPVHQTQTQVQTQPQPAVGLGDQLLTSENPQRHEAQVARSQQSDVAQIAGLSAGSNRTSQVNADIASATSRSPLQEIPGLTTRAIAGVGSGQGTSQQGIDSGSLAQKMQSAELPSETKRAGVLAQVQRGLASMLRSGKSEMTLRLTPGHLGEIKINVKSDGDQLAIRFETTTQEAADYLKSSADELGANLKTKGVEVQHIKIESAEQEPVDADSDDNGSSDSENESNNPQRREDQTNQQSTQTQASEHDSDEPDQGQGVWTELGLDAIA